MHLRESEFERAGELFYEAAAVPELWPKALQAVADACGAAGALLTPLRQGADFALPSPSIKDYVDQFVAEGWAKNNSRMQRGMQLTLAGMKGLITDADMFQPGELKRDRFYNEWIKANRLGATAGMVLANYGHELILPFMIERREADGPFPREEIATMNRLMLQLQSAAKLALKVGFSSAERMADSLSGIGTHIALLGASGRVLHLPIAFERYIGDAFGLRDGLLSHWEQATDRRLAAAIKQVISPAPAGERAVVAVALPRRNGSRPLMAQLVPIAGAAHDIFMLARAVLIIVDPEGQDRVDVVTRSLAALGLSPAEVMLARRIGAGEELKEIAESESISFETARSRLKAVFTKSGTHRQVELVLLIAGLSR